MSKKTGSISPGKFSDITKPPERSQENRHRIEVCPPSLPEESHGRSVAFRRKVTHIQTSCRSMARAGAAVLGRGLSVRTVYPSGGAMFIPALQGGGRCVLEREREREGGDSFIYDSTMAFSSIRCREIGNQARQSSW